MRKEVIENYAHLVKERKLVGIWFGKLELSKRVFRLLVLKLNKLSIYLENHDKIGYGQLKLIVDWFKNTLEYEKISSESCKLMENYYEFVEIMYLARTTRHQKGRPLTLTKCDSNISVFFLFKMNHIIMIQMISELVCFNFVWFVFLTIIIMQYTFCLWNYV